MLATLKAGASRLVEYFVHPGLRDTSDRLYRARVLIALLLGLDIPLITACIANQLADLPSRDHLINIALTAVLVLGNAALLIELRRRGRYLFCSAAAVLLIAAGCTVSIAVSGGIAASPVPLLLGSPLLMAYFFGGVRWGNRMALLVTATVLGFAAASAADLVLPTPAGSQSSYTILHFIIAFVCVSVVSAMAFIYEFTATLLKNERDRNHRKAVALAQTDVLTGLVNRRSFDAHLRQRIAAHAALDPPPPFILCYLDLDDFKAINDRHGHAIGDEVLQNVAERLHAAVRESDIVGRHGGDEFMVLLDTVHGAADARLMAERTLQSIRRPIHTQVGTLSVGASLGFAIYPYDATTAEGLKKAADDAMYAAKRAGGNNWRIGFDIPVMADVAPSSVSIADTTTAEATEDDAALLESTRPSFDRRAQARGAARLVEHFVHPRLRRDSDTLHRAHILVMALLLMFGVVATSTLVVLFAALPLPSTLANLTISGPIMVVIAAMLWQLRRGGSYHLCSTAIIATLLFCTLIGIGVSGGLSYSPAGALLAVPPLMAFFFGGERRGAVITALALTAIIALLIAELCGLQLYNTNAPAEAPFNQLLINVMGLIVMGGMALIYESTTAALMRERDLEHAKVNRLAYTDALTGLANRLDFDGELTVRIEHHKARITRASFALCMVDLDGFKPINDEYGHDIGDIVLQVVSARLLACLRESDYVGRQGGDEFMVIFDGVSTTTQVEVFAQRVARALEQPIETPAGSMRVSASLGFALFPGSADDADDLKRAADRAMYTAKRNRSGWSVEAN